MSRWGMLLGAAVLFAAAPASATQVLRRALVIAHNGSDDASLPPLRFADDDGVLWTETLQRLGVETTLLVAPDEATRQIGRPVLAGARSPTPEEVAREVARLRAAHLADREAGRETELIVVYVGHGNTDAGGRAYFTLAGGRLDRTSFYSEVVDALGADYVHIIVDACRASGVVGSRGQGDAEVLAQLRGVLAREQLSARPNVGVLFAESEDGETHEWSRIRAGVFSHVMRSGLMGGADINADGVVEYSELGAFVTASLQGVKGLPARLTIYASAPTLAPRRPLVGPAPRGPTLVLPPHFEHARISVEDEEGARLADVRRKEGQPLTLRLPERPVYWMRSPTGEARLEPEQLSDGQLQLKPREMQERGPAEEALRRGLFAVALDRPFYEKYVANLGLVPVDFSPRSPMGIVALALAPASQNGWELGLTASQAPLVGTLATGPSVAWRSRPLPRYYGLRAAYVLTPAARNEARVHRFTLQAVGGWQAQGDMAPFLEGAAGWAVVGVTSPLGSQGDLLAFGTHAALGLKVAAPIGHFRLSGLLGMDRISVDSQGRWDLSYGVEVTFRL